MSFVNKLKGWGQKSASADPSRSTATSPSRSLDPSHGAARRWRARPGPARRRHRAAAAFDASPTPPHGAVGESIISEAVPSEIADFTETRLQGADSGAAPLAAACR